MAAVLDKFIQIMDENDLQPKDIDSIKAQPHPIGQFSFANGSANTLRSWDDYCFNGRYLLSCAAHRINPAYWHNPEVRNDPKIHEYMEWLAPKLTVVIDEGDFARTKREDPRTYMGKIEVVAKGMTFKETGPHPKGGWYEDELRNTDEELIKKFTDNSSRVLSTDQAAKAAQAILGLEKIDNVATLLKLVSS